VSGSQPGWYPDPYEPPRPRRALLRYYDGTQWTHHTVPAATPWSGPGAPQYAQKVEPTTPDGVPLAGWWQRVGAYLIDAVILAVIGGLLALPWWRDLVDIYVDFIDQAIRDAEAGRESSVDALELQGDVLVPLAVIALINLAVGFVYHVGFLMWKQATIGKLALGLRVRRRDVSGPMPFGTVLTRWGAQYAVTILSLVPVAGSLVSLYVLLDALWPLWDDNRQAIHDKAAGTNVIRVR